MSQDTETTQDEPSEAQETPRRRRRLFAPLALLWRTLEHGASGLVGLVLVFPVVLLLGLVFATMQAPVALPERAVSWLEARANAQLPEGTGRVAFSEVALKFNTTYGTFDMLTEDAQVTLGAAEDTSSPVIDLPSLSVALDARALLTGQVAPRRVTLDRAELRLQRTLDGRVRFGMDLGQDREVALPASVEEAMALLDQSLATPALEPLQSLQVLDLRIGLEDARTGNIAAVDAIFLDYAKVPGGQTLSLTGELGPLGGGLLLELSRLESGLDLHLELDAVSGESVADLLSPGHVLASLGSDVSGAARGHYTPDGRLEFLEADLRLGAGAIPLSRPVPFDRAMARLAYHGDTRRIAINELSFHSDLLRLVTSGQAFVSETLSAAEPVILQLGLAEFFIDPDATLGTPVEIDEGLLEARVTPAPFALDIGQIMIARGKERVQGSGSLSLRENVLRGAMSFGSDRIGVATVKALWPEGFRPGTRDWVMRNLLEGDLIDLAAAVRTDRNLREPELSASFRFENATFKYLRRMPPATQAFGVGSLHDNRFSLRADRAVVPTEFGGQVQLDETVLTVPDVRARPSTGEVDLKLAGRIGDVLTALDNPPFRVLERAGRGADMATGQARVAGRIVTELRNGLSLPDVSFALEGTLRSVESRTLVKGRVLRSEALKIAISNRDGVTLSGPATLSGAPLEFTWKQPIAEPGQGGPSSLTGTVALSAATLKAFGAEIGGLSVSGQTPARFDVTLGRNGPSSLRLRSDLRGAGLRIPALSWSKGRNARGTFEATLNLGPPLRISDLKLEGPGLRAHGAGRMKRDGSLDVIDFRRVAVGNWLDTGIRLTGRGAGRSPTISLAGGRLDMRRVPAGQSGRGQGGGRPIVVSLDRVVVSEGIVLRNVEGQVNPSRGMEGRIRARLNGGSAIEATLAQSDNGVSMRVTSNNAGGVMASAGAVRNAAGGDFDMRLVPNGRPGQYRGTLRIANLRVRDAPALAQVISAMSIVGLLEQLGGDGLLFTEVDADFLLRPDDILVERATVIGPSLGFTADGAYALASKQLDMQGVISPFYMVNGLLGGIFAPRREGLFGVTYKLTGASDRPRVQVNPLSILTPGIFREIFRRPPPDIGQ